MPSIPQSSKNAWPTYLEFLDFFCDTTTKETFQSRAATFYSNGKILCYYLLASRGGVHTACLFQAQSSLVFSPHCRVEDLFSKISFCNAYIIWFIV